VDRPIILLLEDSLINGTLIERMIFTALPECRLMWARTIEEARLRGLYLQVHLFLIDVELPDGNGLDFLGEMITIQPLAQAIIITAASVPTYRERSVRLGALHFLQKPIDFAQLEELIRSAVVTDESEANAAFHASLNNLTPVDILQLKCLSQASLIIEFRSESNTGRVHITKGQIVHAEAGRLKGMAAFSKIVAWKRGEIVEQPSEPNTKRTIEGDWQSLLMAAAQEFDEQEDSGKDA
jgi:response regulator RpfG family c-di-GMP phosphodiesterase